MLSELRGARLLTGFRSQPPVDTAAVVDLIVRVSELIADVPTVAEIDLNPVLLLPDGAAVADARVILDTS
jgi:hypothetical protein